MKKRPNEVRPRVFVRFYWALALACGLAMSPVSAPAQQQSTWTNVSSGMWTNATRWSNGVPNGVGTIAVFAGGNSGAAAVTNNVAITNSAIIFIPTAGNSYTISSNSSGGILYLQGSGGSALIQAGSASINNSANQILNIPLVMLSNLIMSNLLTSGTLTVGGGITNSGFNLTLEDTGPTTLSGPISGSGGLTKKGTGVLTLSGANTYSGGTLISAGALQGTIAGLQGGITNNASLVFYGSSGGIYGGVISGSGALTISNNTGQVTIFTNQNTFTGTTLVQQGGLTLSNSLGAIGNTASLTLLAGTTLQLDNRGVSNFNRIAGVPLTIQGATLTVLGGGTNNVGAITFGTGGSVISNVASYISGGAFSRGTGFATVNFTGGGTNLFATQAGASNAILPWTFIKGADFATHDGNGTALRAYTNYSTTFAADANVKATTVNSVGGMTINSLVLGTNLTIANDQTLTNTSGGMILTLANQFITNGSLHFSAEAIVENENAATVYSTLVTPSGLTKTGAGILTLLGTNQNAGGILRVNQGSFTVGEGGVVNGGDVLVNAGTFNMNGGAATLNSLVVTNATPGATAILTLGYGTLTTTNGFTLNNAAAVGTVSGKKMIWNMVGGTNVISNPSATSTLGNTSGANSNEVNVTGSLWNNAGNLTVGYASDIVGNQLTISSSGQVINATGKIGGSARANSNSVIVDGSGSLWSNTASLVVGSAGSFNQMIVTNRGSVIAASTIIGESSGGNSNQITITGSGSILTVTGALILAYNNSAGFGNQLLVVNSGEVTAASITVGRGAFVNSNLVQVIGSGSRLTSVGALNLGSSGGSGNQLLIQDGGLASSVGSTLGSTSANDPLHYSNSVVIAGGAIWSNTSTLTIGSWKSYGDQVLVTNGGRLISTGSISLGNNTSNYNDRLMVSDTGSLVDISNKNLVIGGGSIGNGNLAMISNGASLSAGAVAVGIGESSSNNFFGISGNGTLVQLSAGLMVGSNAAGINSSPSVNGRGSVLVNDGGILEANLLQAGYNNTGAISNLGGVFQFTTNTPVVNPNTTGSIIVNNGTISFRGITNADVMGSLGSNGLKNISFSGTNTFRLNSASNTFAASPQNYTFGYTASTPSNYTGLEMINGATAWKSAWLNIGSNSGTMLVSNTSATIAGVTTNSGTVTVVNSRVTWQSNVVISGSYISDPSTNTFVANVTVAPDGYLVGGRVVSNADLFVFEKDLLMLSTNRLFDVSQAGFLFTNSANHLLSISNSGALNIGQGYASFAQVASNFAIGTLSIASGNRMTLSGLTNGPVTNALYVGWLDIQGWSTNSGYVSVTNSLLMALNLPDVNLFYNKYDERNQWLNDFIPDTGYDLWGGGLLLPIPEPSPFLAVGAGLAFLAFLRRRRAS